MAFDKSSCLVDKPPVPVVVPGHPKIKIGRLVPDAKPWVVVDITEEVTKKKQFSWDIIIQALNSKGRMRLSIE